jgi:dihydroflavonol-4-reductase
MKVFVTGSTGMLGNNLVRALLDAGHEVRALARSPQKAARELGDTRARIVTGDMTAVAAFADALSGVDVIFHTAAFFREYYVTGDRSGVIDRINVDATLELARAAHERGVRKMIHTSSAGIVGVAPDGSPGDEQTPPWRGAEKNLYLASKLKAEKVLRAFSRESGFFVAFAMPAWMWGPHDTAPTASGQLVLDALDGKLPPAIPPGGSSVVDVRDVAAAMLRMAEVGRTGERYILSGPFVALEEIIWKLAAAAGTRAPTVRLPFAAALVLAAFAETWARLTRKPSAMSVESIRLMNARLAVTAKKAERELDVRFRRFEHTLESTVAWARAHRQKSGVENLSRGRDERRAEV